MRTLSEAPHSVSTAKATKSLVVSLLLITLSAVTCSARAVRVLHMSALVEQSALVFVGEIKSVEPSGITTQLTYPSWDNVVFEWLKVDVKVREAIKGTKKGRLVRTLMISTRGDASMFNAPGMVHAKVGQLHLLCLLPTTLNGTYASITAPFDDNQGIFLLDRNSWTNGVTYYKPGRVVAFQDYDEKNSILWHLVDDNGRIDPNGVKTLRRKYRAEIAKPAPKSALVHLKWKKEESVGGWRWNVPDEGVGKSKDIEMEGPVTTKPQAK